MAPAHDKTVVSERCDENEDIALDDLYEALLYIEVALLDELDDDHRCLTVNSLQQLVVQGDDRNDPLCIRAHQILLNGVSNPILATIGRVLTDIIASHDARAIQDHALPAFDTLIALLGDGNSEAAKKHWTRHLDAFVVRRR